MKTFRIIDDSDGSNVLGGDVGEENAFLLNSCTVLSGQKYTPLDHLEVGESQVRAFFSCGTRGHYRVYRIT